MINKMLPPKLHAIMEEYGYSFVSASELYQNGSVQLTLEDLNGLFEGRPHSRCIELLTILLKHGRPCLQAELAREHQESQGSEQSNKGQEGSSVNHPKHYNSHPSGVECIDIIEHMPFNIGNAVKYVWRADHKHACPEEDLRKAIWYLNRELERISDKKVD